MCPAAAPAALRPWAWVAPAASAAAFLAAPASSTPIGSLERSQTTPARVKTSAIERGEPLVGGRGDERGALGDHLARVRGPADARGARGAEARGEQHGRGDPVGRHEALGERDHGRAAVEPARGEVGDDLAEPARGDAEEDVVGAAEPRRRPTRCAARAGASRRAGRRGFSRSASSRAHCSRVRVCSVVRKPPRASSTATAVPKDPAPTTTARRVPGEGSARCGRGGIGQVPPRAVRVTSRSAPARSPSAAPRA